MSDEKNAAEPSGASGGYLAWLKGLMAWRRSPLSNPFELHTTDPLKRQFIFRVREVSEVANSPHTPRLDDPLDPDSPCGVKCYSVDVSRLGHGQCLVTAWYR
jgi:hypothetical protein